MGIDLKFLVSSFRERDEMLATASIRADRQPAFLAQFSRQAVPCRVEQLPAGMKVGHYEDAGIRYDDADRYGQPLTYTTSDRLKDFPEIEEISAYNRAALAFLLALPPDKKIVLYWS